MNTTNNNIIFSAANIQQAATTYKGTVLVPMKDTCTTLIQKMRISDDMTSEIRSIGMAGFGAAHKNRSIRSSHMLPGFNCLVDLSDVQITHFPNGMTVEDANLAVRFLNKPPLPLTVPVSMLRHDQRALMKILVDAGVVFFSREAFSTLCRDLLLQLSLGKTKDVYAGICIDTAGNLSSEVQFIDTAAPCDLEPFLCSDNPEKSSRLLDAVSDVGVAELAVTLGIDPIVLTYNIGSNTYAAEDVFRLFQAKPVRLDAVDFDDFKHRILVVDAINVTQYKRKLLLPRLRALAEKIAVVLVVDCLDYVPEEGYIVSNFSGLRGFPAEKIRPTVLWLIHRYPDFLTLLKKQLTGSDFKGMDELTAQVASAKFAFARLLLVTMIGDGQRIEDLMNRYREHLDSEFGVSGKNACELLWKWLCSERCRFVDRLKATQETANVPDVVLFDSLYYYLTTETITPIAEKFGTSPTSFAQALRDEGALVPGDRLQKATALRSGHLVRAYNILKRAVCPLGAVMPGGDGFNDSYPEIRFRIGYSFGKPIYYALRDRLGKDNANTYIDGIPGSGKTYFLEASAEEAAGIGIPVVFLCIHQPHHTLPGATIRQVNNLSSGDLHKAIRQIVAEMAKGFFTADEIVTLSLFDDDETVFGSCSEAADYIRDKLGDDKIVDSIGAKLHSLNPDRTGLDFREIIQDGTITYIVTCDDCFSIADERNSDKVIRELFEFKRENNPEPCLLIVDEVQSFNLNQNAPLSKLVLRQGRKYGFITFLASQFLTAVDARNIKETLKLCDTFVSFTPEDDAATRSRFGIHETDTEWRQSLKDLPRYSFAANGHLASEEGYLGYPIIADVENKTDAQ